MKNQKVLIIGGSEGIGLAMADLYLKAGADVAIASRNQSKLESARNKLGESLIICRLDITDFASAKAAIEKLVESFGVPDILINSAGIAHPRYLGDLTSQEIEQMFRLNSMGPIFACKILLNRMIANGGGKILNVSSVAGYVGLFGYTGYCASKAAVIAFSEALREEVIHNNIQVSVLCPPNTRTPGLDKENEKKPAEVLATEEKVKVLEPEEVAAQAIRGIEKGRFWIIPTFDSQMAFGLKRFAPSILRLFVRRPKP